MGLNKIGSSSLANNQLQSRVPLEIHFRFHMHQHLFRGCCSRFRVHFAGCQFGEFFIGFLFLIERFLQKRGGIVFA